MQANSAASTRDIAMNIYETLVTRDENMKPLLQLAQSVDTSPDAKVFTFNLRQGVHFHNGKLITSADARASFERYARVGIDRSILAPVDHFDTPDPGTFVITLKDPRPAFMEAHVVDHRADHHHPGGEQGRAATATSGDGHRAVAAGPVRRRQLCPAEAFRRLYTGHALQRIDGFGGYKVACLDTVTFRMVPEPGARVAGLETGELQGVEDVPTIAQKRIAANKDIHLLKLENFWLNVTIGNWSAPPTNNLKFRQAVLAALDFDEIMDAASDGDFKPNPSLAISRHELLHRGRQGPARPAQSGEGQEAAGGSRLQRRESGAADQQGLPEPVQHRHW